MQLYLSEPGLPLFFFFFSSEAFLKLLVGLSEFLRQGSASREAGDGGHGRTIVLDLKCTITIIDLEIGLG